MNKPRKVSISRRRFTCASKARNKDLLKLCEEASLSDETIRSNLRNQKIMPDNLESLSKALDVAPEYLQEKGIENWVKYDTDMQQKIIDSHPNQLIQYDEDGYYIKPYSFHTDYQSFKKRFELIINLIEEINEDRLSDIDLHDFIEQNIDRLYQTIERRINFKIKQFIEKEGKK